MEHQYKYDYTKLTDRQIVEKILAKSPNEEAAAFLLHTRYNPLLQKIYNQLTKDDSWFDDCVDELYMHIKGKDGSWQALSNFEWRSTFGCWLKRVAWKKFREVLPKLIENSGHNVPIDNDDPQKPKVWIPVDGEKDIEHFLRKVMLMEEVNKLVDDKQRFVLQKRIEGYPSKAIAILLQMKWKKEGIVVYNNKNEIVVPDEHYVDVLMQRGKKELRKIMVELK